MLYRTEAGEAPAKVTLENLPDGRIRVLLADNAITEEREEGEAKTTTYVYDTVSFYLPSDRKSETVKTITDAFADWWSYGTTDQTPLTIEERVSALEDLMLGEEE